MATVNFAKRELIGGQIPINFMPAALALSPQVACALVRTDYLIPMPIHY